MSSRLIVKLGAAGSVIAGFWWLAMSSPSDAEEVAASSAPVLVEASRPHTPIAHDAVQQDTHPEDTLPAVPAPQRSVAALPSPTPPQSQGPVAELAQRFTDESRSQPSQDAEAQVRAAFVDPAIPPRMLDSVECRHSVCRAELRWSPSHAAAYVLGLTRAVGQFVVPVGIEAAGPADPDGQRRVVVYIGRALHVPSPHASGSSHTASAQQ